MMKKQNWVRLAALTLAALLTAGCAARDVGTPDAEKDVARGRYLESDVTPPRAPQSNVIAFAITRDGGLHLLESQWREEGTPKLRHLVSEDEGESWSEIGTRWAQSFAQDYPHMDIGTAGFTPDGEICFLAPGDENPERMALFRATDENTLERRADVDAELSLFAQFLSGGDFLSVNEEGDILRVGEDTGEERYRIRGTASFPSLFAVYEDRFICLPMDDSQSLTAYDLETGMRLEIPAPDCTANAVAPGPDGALYLASPQGISRLTQGGSVFEIIIEGARSSLGSPALTINGLMCAPDGTLYVDATEGEKQKIIRFAFDPLAPTLPSRELRVYALWENQTLRKALSDFTAARPDVQTSLQIGTDAQTAVTRADALRTLNTELLAGRGPDVLILDGLPIDAYQERGVLLDIGDLARQEDLFGGIVTSLENESGITAIPARVRVPLMVGDADLLRRCETIEGLLETARAGKAPEKGPAGPHNPFIRREGEPSLFIVQRDTDPLRQLFYTSAPAIFTGKRGEGALNEENLAALFKAALPIAEKYKRMEDTPPDDLDFDPRAECFSFSLTDYHAGNALMSIVCSGGVGSLSSGVQWPGPGQTVRLTVAPQCGMVPGAFLPAIVAGVNAAGTETQIARDFVSCLLSDGVQQFEFDEGFPVRISTFESLVEKSRADFGVEFLPDPAELIRSLKTPVLLDDTLFSALLEEGYWYIRGEKPLEDAVESVRTRVEMYYAE